MWLQVVLNNVYDESGVPEQPESGCVVYGPFLEGCRWNDDTGVLDESRPKELFTPMPCICTHTHSPPQLNFRSFSERLLVFAGFKPGRNLESPVGKPPFFETIDPDKRQVVRIRPNLADSLWAFWGILALSFG